MSNLIYTYSMLFTCDMYLVLSIFEKYEKKNPNHFPIAVLLTTLIYSC